MKGGRAVTSRNDSERVTAVGAVASRRDGQRAVGTVSPGDETRRNSRESSGRLRPGPTQVVAVLSVGYLTMLPVPRRKELVGGNLNAPRAVRH
jgi:hypothetical protein